MAKADDLLEQLDRLSRLTAAFNRRDDLNATQMAALTYLATAEGAARKPSKVAEYLAATRGTVSQTLKALKRKGLLLEKPSASDGRSVEYTLSAKGRKVVDAAHPLLAVLSDIPAKDRKALGLALDALVLRLLEARGEAPEPELAEHSAKPTRRVPRKAASPAPAEKEMRVQSAGSAPPFPG
ncbi:MAG: MarR family winged helix-turn-helix transcriptional regulator [Brevirhabdus sp.]